MIADKPAASSPWEFRARGLIAFAIYFFGFYVGYWIASALGGDGTATYFFVGSHWGDTGIRVAAAAAAGLTWAGFVLRFWASSYHDQGVVFSGHIKTGTLTAAGPYRYVRNPLYLGNLLQGIGIAVLGPLPATIIIVTLLWLFLYRLIALEERYLSAAQGDAYAQYRAVVPRLFPHLAGSTFPSSEQRPNVLRGFMTELGTLGFALWMTYFAVATPFAPNRTFFALLWVAIGLFLVSGIANRRRAQSPG